MWIIEYRELIRILTISDLKVKYQSSVLGFTWSLLNPLLFVSVLYLVFSNIYNMRDGQFVIYLIIGIVSWRFISIGTTMGMEVISQKSSLVTKIYIPRQVIIFSSVLSSFISSIFEMLVLLPLILFLGIKISHTILLVPLVHIIYFLIVYGICLILASLYVYYRDLKQIWEVILQAGFFLSPIVYPLSMVPEKYLQYYMLNPITAIISIYHTIILGSEVSLFSLIATALISSILLIMIGSMIFKRLERRFAEEL